VLNGSGCTRKIDRRDRLSNFNVDDSMYQQRVQWLRSLSKYRLDEATELRNTLYRYQSTRQL
jgi:iron complex outermembrane receptor protein